jgi:glycosyltransferase involved in cell wall biosynthesis
LKKVLISYHYLAHYRSAIFKLLCRDKLNEYTIISGTKTDIPISTINEELSELPIEKGGLRWIKIKNIWIFRYALLQFGLIKHILTNKYDTVIFLGVMYYATTWISVLICKLKGTRVIYWTHGFLENEKGIKGAVRYFFYKQADGLLVYGNWSKNILVKKGFDPAKIRIAYNSLNYDEQLKIRNELNYHTGSSKTICFIGRLTKQKKLDLLILAVKRLIAEDHNIKLLFIGDGEEKLHLIQLCSKLEISDHVSFVGGIYDESVIAKEFSKVNLVVSPGEVGLTAIHALTYGIPVLTHDNFNRQMPEFEAIIPDKTGDFFDYENALDSLPPLMIKWLNKDKKEVRQDCFRVIDLYYNPHNQLKIFNSIV